MTIPRLRMALLSILLLVLIDLGIFYCCLADILRGDRGLSGRDLLIQGLNK